MEATPPAFLAESQLNANSLTAQHIPPLWYIGANHLQPNQGEIKTTAVGHYSATFVVYSINWGECRRIDGSVPV